MVEVSVPEGGIIRSVGEQGGVMPDVDPRGRDGTRPNSVGLKLWARGTTSP